MDLRTKSHLPDEEICGQGYSLCQLEKSIAILVALNINLLGLRYQKSIYICVWYSLEKYGTTSIDTK
jgi:hypothetical protein